MNPKDFRRTTRKDVLGELDLELLLHVQIVDSHEHDSIHQVFLGLRILFEHLMLKGRPNQLEENLLCHAAVRAISLDHVRLHQLADAEGTWRRDSLLIGQLPEEGEVGHSQVSLAIIGLLLRVL